MRNYFFVLFLVLISCNNIKNKEKRNHIYKDSAITKTANDKNSLSNIKATLIRGKEGWGYDIFINNQLYIHQPNIPCINGIKGFSSGIKAQKAADLVVDKIKHNIIPPSLNIDELKSIGAL